MAVVVVVFVVATVVIAGAVARAVCGAVRYEARCRLRFSKRQDGRNELDGLATSENVFSFGVAQSGEASAGGLCRSAVRAMSAASTVSTARQVAAWGRRTDGVRSQINGLKEDGTRGEEAERRERDGEEKDATERVGKDIKLLGGGG